MNLRYGYKNRDYVYLADSAHASFAAAASAVSESVWYNKSRCYQTHYGTGGLYAVYSRDYDCLMECL